MDHDRKLENDKWNENFEFIQNNDNFINRYEMKNTTISMN